MKIKTDILDRLDTIDSLTESYDIKYQTNKIRKLLESYEQKSDTTNICDLYNKCNNRFKNKYCDTNLNKEIDCFIK